MSIKLNDGIFVEGPKPAEDKRLKDSANGKVPYASVAEACSLILKFNRYPSLVVCIKEGTENKLYIWKDGIEDTDLVPLKTGDDVTPVTTRIKGGSGGTFVNGDITLLGGTNTEVTQTDKTITINSSYDVSVATASVSGVVKLFSNTVQTASSPAISTIAGKSYGVQLNGAGQMVVNVPWSDTNTTYTSGTTAILNTGTSTTDQVWSAKAIVDWANAKYALISHTHTWAQITNTPTTLSDYGITDTYTKTEVDSKLTSVYRIKGSVANFAALPSTGQVFGDVWNLIDSGANYVWVDNLNNTSSPGWDELSGITNLSGYVPTSRTITINGDTQNLLTNPSWSVGTVTSIGMSVPTGLTVSGSPITSSGTFALTLTSGYVIPTITELANKNVGFINTTTATSITKTATTNANTFLNVTQAGDVAGSLKIVGSGSTTVSSTAEGVITISSTDTNNSYSAGTGLTLTGSVFSVKYGTTAGTAAQGNDSRFHNPVTIGTANGLSLSTQALSLALATPSSAGAMSAADKTKLDGLGTNRYSVDFGVVGTLSYPISHNLGQQFVTVQIFEKSTGNQVEMGVSLTSDSVVTISMNQAPTVANQYIIVVLK